MNAAGMDPRKNARVNRRRAQRRGHFAEHMSAMALRLKGYSILARRFRCPSGEVDLIARRGSHYAFIEVKARKTQNAALEAVSGTQCRRIIRTAEVWLSNAQQAGNLPGEYSVSFDLMQVTPWKWPKHLQSAFDATM